MITQMHMVVILGGWEAAQEHIDKFSSIEQNITKKPVKHMSSYIFGHYSSNPMS